RYFPTRRSSDLADHGDERGGRGRRTTATSAWPHSNGGTNARESRTDPSSASGSSCGGDVLQVHLLLALLYLHTRNDKLSVRTQQAASAAVLDAPDYFLLPPPRRDASVLYFSM